MELLVFVLLIAASAFLSAAETSIFSVSKFKLHALVRENKPGAAALTKLKSNPNRLLATITISNNLLQIFAASLATFLATRAFGSLGIGIATGVITILLTVFGESVPKSLAAHRPISIALFSAPLLEALSILSYPLVVILESISAFFTKAFAGESAVTEEELKAVIAVSEEAGVLGADAAEIMENVIEFGDVKVGEVMTPEAAVVYLDGDRGVKEVLPTLINSDYHRFPVFEGNEENITGIFDVDVVFRVIEKNSLDTKVKELSIDPFIVPENKKVADLLKEFAKKNIEFALVVDEHGSFTGVVSIEDVLEEIVGDIFDKSLKIDRLVREGKEGSLEIEGHTRVADLEKILHVNLKGEGFTTLSGLIQTHLGRIPKVGEKLKLKNFELTIEDSDAKTIRKVRLNKLTPI